jgi:hypothetical protein
MKALSNVQIMREFAPDGGRLNYLVSEGRVYASAKSWRRAFQVPESMASWFDSRTASTPYIRRATVATICRDHTKESPCPRVPLRVVAMSLRNFDQ